MQVAEFDLSTYHTDDTGLILNLVGEDSNNTALNMTGLNVGFNQGSGHFPATMTGTHIGDWSGGATEAVALRIQEQSHTTTHDWSLKIEEPAETPRIAMFGVLANGGIRTLDCTSTASPAVCDDGVSGFGKQSGSVTVAAAATTKVVNDSAVTANSQIFVQFDESLGTKLGVTCNTAGASEAALYFVSARTAGTSFTIKTNVAPTTNPACLSFHIVN